MPAVRRRSATGLGLALGLVLALAGCGEQNPTAADPPAAASVRAPNEAETMSRVIAFRNQLQKEPFSADARLGLGLALLEQADPRAAEAELSRALELGVDKNRVLPELARTWLLLGRSKDLIDVHAGTVLSNPAASAELKAALGTAYANTGRAAKARELAASALQDDPSSSRALVLQAQIALATSRVDDAVQLIERALAAHPDAIEAWDLKADLLLFVKKDRAGAVAAYEQALARNPRNLPIHSKLIATAIGAKDLATAQARLAKVIAIAPTSLPRRYFEARLQFERGDFDAARGAVMNALSEYPNDLRSLLLSAELDLMAGSTRAAEDSLARAISIAPGLTQTRHMLAKAYLRMGTPEKAQEVLEPLLRSDRQNPTTLGLLADSALQLGRPTSATALYERAAAADPRNPRYRTALALARIGTGDVEAGFRQLESATATDPTVYSEMALLSARLRAGDLNAAIKVAENLVRKQPKQPLPLLTLGQLKLSAKKPDEARQHFERAAELDRAFVPAVIALAALDLESQQPAKARQRIEAVLAQAPNNLDAMLAMAEILSRAGSPGQAVVDKLSDAVRVHPSKVRARLALINHLIQIDQAAAALVAAQNATQALADDPAIVDALGRAQLAAGESAQALGTFRRLAGLAPRSADPYLRMAETHQVRNEMNSALDAVKDAIARNPANVPARIKLTELTTATKDWRAALRSARDVQTRLPADPRGFHLEGLVHVAQQHWDPAIAAFRGAMQRGESSELVRQLHTALLAAGKTEDAKQLSQQWLAKHPKDAFFIGYLGERAILTKDYAAAEGHFRTVLQGDPDNAEAMNNLAWLMVEQSRQGAVDVARKAVARQPGRADILDTLSMALAKENQLPAAIDNQKKAVELAPGLPVLKLHLAQLALQAKDFVLARGELDKLSAMGSAFPDQEEVYRLRKQLP